MLTGLNKTVYPDPLIDDSRSVRRRWTERLNTTEKGEDKCPAVPVHASLVRELSTLTAQIHPVWDGRRSLFCPRVRPDGMVVGAAVAPLRVVKPRGISGFRAQWIFCKRQMDS